MASKSKKMADTSSSPLHASVMWAQRKDKLYVTINLEDSKDPQITLNENSFHFKGKGGPDHKDYEVKIDFLKEIIPDESKYQVLPRNVPCMIKKKEEGEFWPRLLKDSKKVHWLKTDFQKWKDEDDSDYEDDSEKEMNFEQMMQNMGGPGGMGGDNEDEPSEDSDDEEIPDLE